MPRPALAWLAWLSLVGAGWAQSSPDPLVQQGVPLPLAEADPDLQADLAEVVASLAQDLEVPATQIAVSLLDLTRSEPAYAGVGDGRQVYAASLPKIAILYGAFASLEAGALDDTPALRADMTAMIRDSNNAAATRVLHLVGFEALLDHLRAPSYRLYDWDDATRIGVGGLWVGKAFGKGGRRVTDPKGDTSHGATTRQATRFFALVQQERLVSTEAARQMKEILSRPAIAHKFVKGLEAHRPGALMYRKSGTWRTYHADGAIVEQPARDGQPAYSYVAVGLVEHELGSDVLEQLIGRVDDVIRARATRALEGEPGD